MQDAGESLHLRTHRPSDIGWLTRRHGVLYAREHGWDERFEALVADIAAKFVNEHDPQRERLWIAERAGEPVGGVMLVEAEPGVAQLRLLLVEPAARRTGLGARLIDECVRFARDRGYRRLVLWTQRNLDAARRLYERAGFELVEETPHRSWGHDLVSQNWSLDL